MFRGDEIAVDEVGVGFGFGGDDDGDAVDIGGHRAQPAAPVGTGDHTAALQPRFDHPGGRSPLPDDPVAGDQVIAGGADMAADGNVGGAEIHRQYRRAVAVTGDDDPLAACAGTVRIGRLGSLALLLRDTAGLLDGQTTFCHSPSVYILIDQLGYSIMTDSDIIERGGTRGRQEGKKRRNWWGWDWK